MLQQISSAPLYFMVRALTPLEGVSYFIAQSGSILNTIISSLNFGSVPLYYIGLHIWTTVFGVAEITMRSFSLFWFAVFILCIHHILVEFLDIEGKESYMKLLLFVLNPLLLFYAMQVTPHMMFIALTTLNIYFLMKRRYAYYVIAGICAGLTHWSFLAVLLFQGIGYLTISRKKNRRSQFRIFSIVLFLIPVVGIIFFQTSQNLFSQLLSFTLPVFLSVLFSFLCAYVLRRRKGIIFRSAIICLTILFIMFSLVVKKAQYVNIKLTSKSIKAVMGKNDKIFVVDVSLFYPALYYFGDDVFVYRNQKLKETDTSSLIPKAHVTNELPDYPEKAFIVEKSGYTEARASY